MTKKPIIISFGDPGSLNAEILLKWMNLKKDAYKQPIILIGSKKSFIYFAKLYNYTFMPDGFIQSEDIKKIVENNTSGLFLYDPNSEYDFDIGVVSKQNGFLSCQYLQYACEIVQQLNNNAILLTMPLNKKSVSLFFPGFIGHTEFLQDYFKLKHVTMIMHSKQFSIALVTTHIPVLKLHSVITKELFETTMIYACNYFESMNFKRGLGVLALNPHASDMSLIGNEEDTWIHPIIEKTSRKYSHIKIEGPISSDTAFSSIYMKHNQYDLYVAFYHDQGLIPFKIIAGISGINLTYGIPFLRVSPDHGTGFDLVGKNEADISSLMECFSVIDAINK